MQVFIFMFILLFVIINAESKIPTKKTCLNGSYYNNKCHCDNNYIGDYCEKEIHCKTNERNSDGTCHQCKDNYKGKYCEDLICKHGKQHELEQKCICNKPYSGEFCDKLTTADVYLHYNSKQANFFGPLGALLIIPLFLIYYGCEYFAQKRQVKRIGQMWSDQNVSVDSQAVKNLLDD